MGDGEKCALSSTEHENGAQRLVKAPFLAQIDFSWSRNAKMV